MSATLVAPMKVVIQSSDTNRFYQGDGNWTANASEAKIFSNSHEAKRTCAEERLHNTRILFDFGNPKYNFDLQCG
jgi:hypothetical protein